MAAQSMDSSIAQRYSVTIDDPVFTAQEDCRYEACVELPSRAQTTRCVPHDAAGRPLRRHAVQGYGRGDRRRLGCVLGRVRGARIAVGIGQARRSSAVRAAPTSIKRPGVFSCELCIPLVSLKRVIRPRFPASPGARTRATCTRRSERTPMTIRIVRLGTARAPDEGTRLGIVRRPPRGVPKDEVRQRQLVRRLVPGSRPQRRAHEGGPDAAETDRHRAASSNASRSEMNVPLPAESLDALAALSPARAFLDGLLLQRTKTAVTAPSSGRFCLKEAGQGGVARRMRSRIPYYLIGAAIVFFGWQKYTPDNRGRGLRRVPGGRGGHARGAEPEFRLQLRWPDALPRDEILRGSTVFPAEIAPERRWTATRTASPAKTSGAPACADVRHENPHRPRHGTSHGSAVHGPRPMRSLQYGESVVNSAVSVQELTTRCSHPRRGRAETEDVKVRNRNTGLIEESGDDARNLDLR